MKIQQCKVESEDETLALDEENICLHLQGSQRFAEGSRQALPLTNAPVHGGFFVSVRLCGVGWVG